MRQFGFRKVRPEGSWDSSSMRSDRVAVANAALDTFIPGVRLYQDRELRMAWSRHDFPARLRSQGDLPAFGYRHRPTGGTGMQALAQLIRYVRDLPRFPLATWEYWAGERVKLCTALTVELIGSSDYGDPTKTRCVLCGDSEFKRGLDWWSLDGITGPCCGFGRCRPVEAHP